MRRSLWNKKSIPLARLDDPCGIKKEAFHGTGWKIGKEEGDERKQKIEVSMYQKLNKNSNQSNLSIPLLQNSNIPKDLLIELAYESFCKNFEMFRKNFDIKTICMHVSPFKLVLKQNDLGKV